MMYEYKTVCTTESNTYGNTYDDTKRWVENDLQKTLNQLAHDGWEYVGPVNIYRGDALIFRRERKQ